jgi:hypothetical protein
MMICEEAFVKAICKDEPFRLMLLMMILATALARPASAQPSTEPLLRQSNLVYQGAFRLPQTNCGPTYACFSYGGTAITYDAADNSLYIVGHRYGQMSAEVSIPSLVDSNSLSALNTATLLQPFADATDAKRNDVNILGNTQNYIGGQLVFNNQLVVSVYSYYDGGTTQSTSHFIRPMNLSTQQVTGPYKVGSQYPGFVSGYMTMIPAEWQGPLGGPALTGNCCLAIAAAQSNGPAVSAFNPAPTGATNSVLATPLVGYPYSDPLGTGWRTQSTLYNGTTQITGVAFPSGTRSVLFFGRQGTGPFCYGSGTADASLDGQPTGQGDNWCYDPANSSKGVHGYPYSYQVWAYDANDLAAVAKGTKAQYQIQPYAVWTFHLPFENSSDNHFLGGIGFDPQNSLIYISQLSEDSGTYPIIHAFKVVGSLPSPSPPTGLAVH